MLSLARFLHVSPFLLSSQAPKRLKAGSGSDAPCPPPSLTPEQLERIRRNREAARQRLAARNNAAAAGLAPPEMAPSWRDALGAEFAKPYFAQLMAFVAEERRRYTVYPPPDQVFTWTQMSDIRDVSQLRFQRFPLSVGKHLKSHRETLTASLAFVSCSLENIYKELAADIEGFSHPGHGDLTGWAKQGDLLFVCLFN
ncbi:hypothetical protein JD844_015239 [Phrynosoma platyrhinos]|uniref:Uncharacterized protein n=1 Tax=Phrynosoma platyrhinos TaxID=52577 RepID=A0ABQ7T7D6_PHRPL|nr:hypothetical protein JD844_015239 [Phrynosoma platyrhinos]